MLSIEMVPLYTERINEMKSNQSLGRGGRYPILPIKHK